MSFDDALRLTETLLASALIMQSLEHLRTGEAYERALMVVRTILCAAILLGFVPPVALAGLMVISIAILIRFDGPYNGGADRMGLLVMVCVIAAYWLPAQQLRELALGYLALQLVLSYLVSGWVKIVNPDWRSGAALRDVFSFSAYPVSEDLRKLADRPQLLLIGSWAVMLFELVFPLSLLWTPALLVALGVAALFHLANACMFGLNRFFWVWLSAYPAIIWFQGRFVG